MKRKIAAILAADIAGYSRLVAEDEEETLRRLGSYRAVFTDFVARYGGRIFNTAGDATLAEFQSAVDAVRCAVDVQESLRTRNLAYAPSRQMSYRIGITIGDVVERDGDLLGDGVNIASRLESMAPAGGICISRFVYEAVTNKISLKFDDLGLLQFKNIPDRVHAYTVALDQPGRSPMQSATAWRTLGLAAVLMIAVAVTSTYLVTRSLLPLDTSSGTGDASPQTSAGEPGKTAVTQSKSDAPAANTAEEKPTPDAGDGSTGTDAKAGAPVAKDTATPAAAAAAAAVAPAVEQNTSGAPEQSAQADQGEESCRRYLPSIGKTVEVTCESAQEAERAPQSDTPPPPEAEAAVHPFKDLWGTSLATCQRRTTYGDWKESDRLIIFGPGALQYMRLGHSQICQSAQIVSRNGTFSLRAACLGVPANFYLGKLITAAVEDGDITLAGDGQRLVGIGPDGQSLQLTKCN